MFSANAKKDPGARRSTPAGFSGFRADLNAAAVSASRLVHCDFMHVGDDVQRSSTSKAPITIDTQSTEKSI
jgi:hypothetical protein